ncbi:hypothetical protein ACHZG4_002117 [Yersinia enterocolitica]|nr:hypothetical protein [Yersinia enterocolitica]ELI8060531.1 hypothetical protein [Yersinia enterocolitica]HDY4924717.1 hypothetical protein [Yersinia enterocolitica]HDY4932801.1 hypothetical protein [Yersinia enterocolitica]
MFNTNSPSIRDWFKVLNWSKLPNFGNCHSTNDYDHFQKNYYCNEDIDSLYINLITTLSSGLNSQNIRIAGEPGAGKTSFLYAFKYMCENAAAGSELDNYVIYIVHINRTYDVNNQFFIDEANQHIIDAWKYFYSKCSRGNVFSEMQESSDNPKNLLNKLSDYYKKNKKIFNKMLILAIDDVDLLSGEQVNHAVEHLLRSIEINSVKKWLSIRRVTLENYNGTTKKKIEEFFPDPYEFPSIPIYDLIDYRIKQTCGNSTGFKNPFNELLCNEIISSICEKNLRESLGLCKTILEDNLPGKFNSSTDEVVISNYIQTSAIKSLCSSQKLIDLHSDSYRLTIFPLAVDILACTQFHTDENIIFGAVNDCCIKRANLAGISEEGHIYKIRTSEFNDVIKTLISHGCIAQKTIKERIFLTEKGKVTITFALREYYYEYCKRVNNVLLSANHYWAMSSKKIDHKSIVDVFITWRDRNRPSN